jgi:hypothetical protein
VPDWPVWLDLDLLQTIAVVASVVVAVWALGRTIRESSQAQQRRRLERVLDAVLELNHLAIRTRGVSGQGPQIEALQAKLHALVLMAGVPVQQLHHADLLTRVAAPYDSIPRLTEAALLELVDLFRKVD